MICPIRFDVSNYTQRAVFDRHTEFNVLLDARGTIARGGAINWSHGRGQGTWREGGREGDIHME